MPQIIITVPEGTVINVVQQPEAAAVMTGTEESESPSSSESRRASTDDIARYWHEYLSDNGREFYAAGAAIERRQGTFTMADVAEATGRELESVRSIHRTTGRCARKWREDMRLPADAAVPIEIVSWEDYDPAKGYGVFVLPDGVAEAIGRVTGQADQDPRARQGMGEGGL